MLSLRLPFPALIRFFLSAKGDFPVFRRGGGGARAGSDSGQLCRARGSGLGPCGCGAGLSGTAPTTALALR